MGFPVGYSDEVMLPRVVLHALLLLGHLHRFLLWAFRAVGLGDLVDLGVDYPLPDQELGSAHGHGGAGTGAEAAPPHRRRPEFRTVLVEEALPVVRFDELACGDDDSDCAVCLCGIGAGDEVRRLGNCRHAFHRGCLDRWMAHDQRTCPLCRAPLFPPGDPWAATAAAPWPVDAADYDLYSYPSLLPMVPIPTLLRPQELLFNGLDGFQ